MSESQVQGLFIAGCVVEACLATPISRINRRKNDRFVTKMDDTVMKAPTFLQLDHPEYR